MPGIKLSSLQSSNPKPHKYKSNFSPISPIEGAEREIKGGEREWKENKVPERKEIESAEKWRRRRENSELSAAETQLIR